jgi:RNA polymerase sigma factor (sigma-70 family)
MSGGHLHGVIRHLRQMVSPDQDGGLPDAELLRRWVAGRDEAAFEVLLWRHAPMVLGVCRRVLRDAHEAEDAFQATFLALARKAGSIGRREAPAGWLYRVAYRTALQAKAGAARRPAQDAEALAARAAETGEDLVWRDLRPVLDEEVSRLPEKYRLPFVLCHLEGKTNEEAARELGCPLGTVLSRLARARERLRARLTRRGITLPAGALAAALSGSDLSAAVPARFVGLAAQAALAAAPGGAGVVSPGVCALAEGVLRGMAMTKLKTAAVLVLALGLLGTGAGAVAHRLSAGQEPPPRENAGEKAGVKGPQEGPAKRPAPVAPDKAQEARRHAELLAQLRDAERRLTTLEDDYPRLEKEWTEVLIEARQKLVREEERVRMLEREQAAERDRESGQLRAAQAALDKVAEVQAQQQPAQPKYRDLGDLPRELKRLQERVEELEALSKKREAERTDRLIQARQALVREEERLRQVERKQAFERERAEARVRAAAEQVREAERRLRGADAPPPRAGELDRKLEVLLREVRELRREIERQRPGGGRGPGR